MQKKIATCKLCPFSQMHLIHGLLLYGFAWWAFVRFLTPQMFTLPSHPDIQLLQCVEWLLGLLVVPVFAFGYAMYREQ